jgi:hypothetical protein
MNLMTPATGFVVGFCVGLTGMGGGALMTPLLVLTLGVSPSVAIGTDLAYAALTKAVGAWQHWRQDTVEPRLVLYLAGGELAGLSARRGNREMAAESQLYRFGSANEPSPGQRAGRGSHLAGVACPG